MELKNTIQDMCSADYKERFRAEFQQTKIRYMKLRDLLERHAKGNLDFVLTCPIELLNRQLMAMQEYLAALEARADIECIALTK